VVDDRPEDGEVVDPTGLGHQPDTSVHPANLGVSLIARMTGPERQPFEISDDLIEALAHVLVLSHLRAVHE
jgi:hypothetical protein